MKTQEYNSIIFSEKRKNVYEPREGEELIVIGEVKYFRKSGTLGLTNWRRCLLQKT